MLVPRIGMADRCLGRTQLTWCTAIILATSLMTACDSGGNWVDVAGTTSNDFERIKKDPKEKEAFEQLVMRGVCSAAGKSYTGEWRIEKGGLQVKCK